MSYLSTKAAWCSYTVNRRLFRNNRVGAKDIVRSRQGTYWYFSWCSIKQKQRNKKKNNAYLLVHNNPCIVPYFRFCPGWVFQAISQINLWFKHSRNTHTFLKIIISFPLCNLLPPPEMGFATTGSLGLFPHSWHYTMSGLSLWNAWRSAEIKRKTHTHTTLTSSPRAWPGL